VKNLLPPSVLELAGYTGAQESVICCCSLISFAESDFRILGKFGTIYYHYFDT
jgi:hypothetical protein